MLSDLSNEAQTKEAQRMWDASKKDREGMSQETELAGLRIDKTVCSSVRAWIVCLREREGQIARGRETINNVYKVGKALDLWCVWPEI